MEIEGIESLALVLGVSHQTIADWQKEGLPVKRRGGPGTPSLFDAASCIQWHTARAVQQAKAKAQTPVERVYQLKGNKIENELDKLLSQLLRADAIEPMWTAAIEQARAALDAERLGILDEVDDLSDVREILSVLRRRHEGFLRRMSTLPASSRRVQAGAGG